MNDDELGNLLPARMLNEYAYCPRLAYLEWVQGEWADNSDTLEGEFVHRNVDVADDSALPDLPDPPGHDQLHARSVRLENQQLGLVAVIDVLEADGDNATPIDYKKSIAPDIPEGAWEPERVQLCAQGLLLRAAGYHCHEGIIWFAGSRKRVTIPFDDALIARTLQLISDCQAMATSGKMPLPLIDSPKCPRCSLVSICLPDETNFLLHRQSPDAPATPLTPRRLLSPRPETVPLHITEPGARLGKRHDCLIVERKQERLAEVRINDISAVCLYGAVQVSTQALHALLDREIPICYFTSGGWFRGIAHGMPHKNIELRIRQHAAAADPQQSLRLARAFVSGKIRNARTLLRRNLTDDPEQLLPALHQHALDAEQAQSLPSLLGIEGFAAKRYFTGFAQLLASQSGFQFASRNRRPPTDPVNAVLSFLYALLTRECTTAALAAGLDPYLGFLHQPRYGRPALALDLAEEFRPILADSTALSLFNTAELQPDHFIRRGHATALTTTGRKAVLHAWERRLHSEVTHPLFGYSLAYRRVIQVQARLIARVLLGELPHYPPIKTR